LRDGKGWPDDDATAGAKDTDTVYALFDVHYALAGNVGVFADSESFYFGAVVSCFEGRGQGAGLKESLSRGADIVFGWLARWAA
jgi:hypothetical protein